MAYQVIIGHMAGENHSHCEMYRPGQEREAHQQACYWKQVVKYDDVKVINYNTQQEAEWRMHQIEHQGW